MWVNKIIGSIRFGLQFSNSITLSINRWIEVEQKNSVKKSLSEAINFYAQCNRLIEISTFGGPATVMIQTKRGAKKNDPESRYVKFGHRTARRNQEMALMEKGNK